MSVKECEHHKGKKRKIFRQVFWCLVVFLFIVLVTILLIWAILRPTKPTFTLQDVTVYAFNATVANFLTSNFQVTLISRNPNDRIGVYYDRLETFVTSRTEPPSLRHIKAIKRSMFGLRLFMAPTSPSRRSISSASARTRVTVTSSSPSEPRVGFVGRSAPSSPAATTSTSAARRSSALDPAAMESSSERTPSSSRLSNGAPLVSKLNLRQEKC
ncbi:hypothetical protein glysoja_046323 [Glycine soja]|uniref:Late embryogenesis abundant protein LEA-2 subgroup domain-containing protein n=1 Tax=Glycine soja TaxID=3848 RepID=A0A0B2RMD6_GLYSO|nr:hypothetical protein glysoja_046323 [Glycine soja]